jgi:hypothetical protein
MKTGEKIIRIQKGINNLNDKGTKVLCPLKKSPCLVKRHVAYHAPKISCCDQKKVGEMEYCMSIKDVGMACREFRNIRAAKTSQQKLMLDRKQTCDRSLSTEEED